MCFKDKLFCSLSFLTLLLVASYIHIYIHIAAQVSSFLAKLRDATLNGVSQLYFLVSFLLCVVMLFTLGGSQ